MKYVPLAARMYRILLAWDLEKVFCSFFMIKDGARMRQKIRDATNSFIENDAPPQYRQVLRPDYEPGCKRRVNTATYLAALHSPNMLLAKDRVTKIGPHHVETESGAEYQADAIIFATGFTTQKWLHPIRVKGKNAQDLHEVWDAPGDAEAYKGTVVTGFPNFFIRYGPKAATGQHSVIFRWLRTIFPRWSDFEVRRVETLGGSSSKVVLSTLLAVGLGSVAVWCAKDVDNSEACQRTFAK
ncbi:hypothetical protein FALCPG4_009929 [Fusarium falciforme]